MEKRFKGLKQISVSESNNLISSTEDLKNSFIRFYTLSPSQDEKYPASEGWEDVDYFTARSKKSVPSNGEGEETIYVLSNPSYPGLLKIGYTRKEIGIRVKDLSKSTGVPTPFKLEYVFKYNGGMELESEIHTFLKEFRVNNYREFFDINLKKAIQSIKFVGDRYL